MPIYGLERFAPGASHPAEFRNFWALSVAELHECAPEPVIEKVQAPAPGLSLWRVKFRSQGQVLLEGYLLRPKGGQSCPLIVHAHGYNDRFDVQTDWALRGAAVFGFDVRGFGRSAGIPVAEEGYVLTGFESPETSILRGAVLDFLQAVRTARELMQDQQRCVVYYGFSFGGGLALKAAALSRDVALAVLGQPTFAWNAERYRLAKAGSSLEVRDFITEHPWRRSRVLETLEYFDTLHFAPLVTSPCIVGIGLDDDVVPSRTVIAAANFLKCAAEVRLLPVSHSADPRESLWHAFHDEWLDYAINGVPADFGSQSRQVRALVAVA